MPEPTPSPSTPSQATAAIDKKAFRDFLLARVRMFKGEISLLCELSETLQSEAKNDAMAEVLAELNHVLEEANSKLDCLLREQEEPLCEPE